MTRVRANCSRYSKIDMAVKLSLRLDPSSDGDAALQRADQRRRKEGREAHHAQSLYFMRYNFVRIHLSLRCRPAMEAAGRWSTMSMRGEKSPSPHQGDRTLQEPVSGERAHAVDRGAPRPPGHAPGLAAGGAAEREHAEHEEDLSDLDSHVEGEERERDLARRQPRLAQRGGEAEAVEEAEGGGHRPRAPPHEGRGGRPAGEPDRERQEPAANRASDHGRRNAPAPEPRRARPHRGPDPAAVT